MFFNRYRGGMLTGSEIAKQVKKGNITIDPFSLDRVNPNSYNLSLHPVLRVYARNSNREIGNIIPQKKVDDIPAVSDISTIHEDGTVTRTIGHPIEGKLISSIDTLADNAIINSYRLSPLDSKADNKYIEFEIPEEGYVLQPGVLYLGRTNEFTGTDKFIPMINGRSSGGRLGISIHVCAGFGDVGFHGTWTLEITAVEPVRIYPYQELAQVSFHTPYGKIGNLYEGKYKWQIDPGVSRMQYDFEDGER